jgi:hypothetical protein
MSRFLVITELPFRRNDYFEYGGFTDKPNGEFYYNTLTSLHGDIAIKLTLSQYIKASEMLKRTNIIFNKKKGIVYGKEN